MKVAQKTFVVTGAGNGMGREMTLLLLKKGARVAAADMSESALNETAVLAGDAVDRLSLHVLNIADREQVQAFPERVIERHGQVDGIINNAGIIQPFVRVNELAFEAAEKVMNVNFYGTLNMIKAFLPHLLQRPEAHIANVSSMGGFLPVPGQSIYGASKAAVKLMTEGLYAELSNTMVKVSVIFPGAIATNISANSGVIIPGGEITEKQRSSVKTLPAAEAARIMIEGIENDKLYIYVGRDSRITNLLYRLAPGFATRMIAKKMRSLLG